MAEVLTSSTLSGFNSRTLCCKASGWLRFRTEYLAVTPWGDLYPCHQFVGNEKFLLGNVDTGIVNTDIRDEFKLCNVYAKETCKDCFARFYCSGGCSANAYNFSGSINGAMRSAVRCRKRGSNVPS